VFRVEVWSLLIATCSAFKNTFLTQLLSINIRSREFPNALTSMLESQEGMNTAMSLQGDDALTLVDILDQVSVPIIIGTPRFIPLCRPLRLRTWISTSEEGVFGSSGKSAARRPSCHALVYSRTTFQKRETSHLRLEGSQMFGKVATMRTACASKRSVLIQLTTCQKSSRYAGRGFTCNVNNVDDSWQRLFQEIVIWRRLSHPNVLPVLGVSPKLFPLCVITEWMIDGNIMDFTSKHPEANRLRLVRPNFSLIPTNPEIPLKLADAASGLQYLHSMDIVHSDLKPVCATNHLCWLSLMVSDRQTSSSTAISILGSLTTGSSPSYRIRTL